jgi:hypothetical protein|tara:strand:+ start:255 stop:485 length:231 start_codon:yes stop_codon:yes gene_type:complete
MAISKTGGLANTICTPNGIVNKDTGKIVVVNDNSFYVHSKEFMDNWNKPVANAKSETPPVKAKAAPKKKKAWYKKK